LSHFGQPNVISIHHIHITLAKIHVYASTVSYSLPFVIICNVVGSIHTTTNDAASLAVNAPASASMQAQQPSMGMISRPKTSHTTIERRYRTNLNARITSLRMAVPALRVLEDKEGTGVGGGGKKGKNSTLGKAVQFGTKVKKENEDGTDVIDVIDERGFVDGVKVARKCSKANVLGKAVEYIR
ncbi:hypothetical protein MPER_15295, partial [Moniliophthora perniciosa FA553]